jgi:peptidyl-prolyl cis-trans isomerase A (cyclophilin A)
MNGKIFSAGFKHYSTISVLAIGLMGAVCAHATTVQFQTVMGDFEVNLFDKTTPKTVENFLKYVEEGAFEETIIHRSVPDFIVQGGGYNYPGTLPLKAVTSHPAVVNEPVYSNRRGTIAMAKVGNNPNSATNQWFFNLKDNSGNLDRQNGGFTVFGQVTGNGMAIIDAMAAVSRFNKGGALNEIPLRNYTTEDHEDDVKVTDEHFVMIQNIVVLDESPDTADGLNPVKNTSLDDDDDDNDSGGGGGSIGFLTILLLGFLAAARTMLVRRRQVS